MAKKMRFKTVDVFTDRVFLGNPLAVFLDCIDLEKEEMQLIAKEIGYSETAFVFPPKDPNNSAMVRIFTPASELPFAGHPNIGISYILSRYPEYTPGQISNGKLILEQKAGNVKASKMNDKVGKIIGSEIITPEYLNFYDILPVEKISKAIGIDELHICDGKYAPKVASVGLPFAITKIDSAASLSACKVNISEFRYLDEHYKYTDDGFSILAYAHDTENRRGFDLSLRARVFCPLMGIDEDPATGSACAALAGFLLSIAEKDKKQISICIIQGVEIGRQSEIYATALKDSSQNISVRIGGKCVELIDGVLEI